MKTTSWVILTAIALALVGALVALGASTLFFVEQANVSGSRIWPLPALILIDWGVMGVLGFLGALRGTNPVGFAWLKASWFAVGGLLPYVVLGAFSIGPYVLLSLLFILASAVILTTVTKGKWLEQLVFLLAGAICNLGFYLILVAISTWN